MADFVLRLMCVLFSAALLAATASFLGDEPARQQAAADAGAGVSAQPQEVVN
ncbi:hypothetical protein AGMMS49543_25710 [Betaproteobacteria bacterium]|nr:hypothetical protein AGMMS49543_25710 [Betaproteobacteria bacterium]GHU18298.1 hypothetical protein AGMMS50243_08090 [Betaproteobacteria bacterium]